MEQTDPMKKIHLENTSRASISDCKDNICWTKDVTALGNTLALRNTNASLHRRTTDSLEGA